MQLPSIMWLVIKKPKRFSAKWIINWVNHIVQTVSLFFFWWLFTDASRLCVAELHIRWSFYYVGIHNWRLPEYYCWCIHIYLLHINYGDFMSLDGKCNWVGWTHFSDDLFSIYNGVENVISWNIYIYIYINRGDPFFLHLKLALKKFL